MSGHLIVMAALIGISRAFFGHRKEGPVKRTLSGLQETFTESGRGRTAEKPNEIPSKGWKDIAWRVYDGLQNDRVFLVAAGVTFYALLALFPATASHGQGTLGLTFIGTLALSLWGANAGTKATFDALNIIYKEREKRSFVRLTLWSLLFTLGAIALVLVAVAGIVAVPLALKLLGIPTQSATGFLTLLRWPLMYLVMLFALAGLYRYGPSRTHPQWRWVTWGSAIAGGIWVVSSLVLSWYVANFGTYNATYGSLGAVIGFMVWMWLSTIIVLMGGEINAEMEHQTARDTTEGRRKPMGARGAKMADEVGEARA
jgi:membrane protein